jgi:hypothetical protein
LAALPDLSLPTVGELRATGTTDSTPATKNRESNVACYVAFSGSEMSNPVRDDAPKSSAGDESLERKKTP